MPENDEKLIPAPPPCDSATDDEGEERNMCFYWGFRCFFPLRHLSQNCHK